MREKKKDIFVQVPDQLQENAKQALHDVAEMKENLESEIAIFWSRISDFLPKSLEREALGDEKIFRAFKVVYPDIRSFLESKTKQSLLLQIEEIVGEDIYTKDLTDDEYLIAEGMTQEKRRIREGLNKLKE